MALRLNRPIVTLIRMIDTTVRFQHYEDVDLEAVRMHGAIQRTVFYPDTHS